MLFRSTNPTSTGSSITWGNGAVAGQQIRFKESNDALQAYSQGVRIVSACVTSQTEVTTLTDSGEGTAFVTPFDLLGGRGNTTPVWTVPYADIVKNFGSCTIPNNKKKNLVARWFPTKRTLENHTDTGLNAFDYTSFIDPSINSPDDWPAWEFGIVHVGLPTTGSGIVRFEIIINYEFIPIANAVNIIDAQPFPVDPQEEALVETRLPDMPKAGTVPDKTITSPAATSQVEEPGGGTGFGMFFHVLEELAPLAIGALAAL